jgi:hypothetical protein
VVILYLLRPYIVLIASMGASQGRSGGMNISTPMIFIALRFSRLFLRCCSSTRGRGKPGAGTMVVKLWAWRKLLVAAAILNMPLFYPVAGRHRISIHLLGWVQVVIAVIIIFYLLGSRRVRDTFADFPLKMPSSGGWLCSLHAC